MKKIKLPITTILLFQTIMVFFFAQQKTAAYSVLTPNIFIPFSEQEGFRVDTSN